MSSQTGQIIIPNVKNGVKYQVRLRGKNRVKHSNWSNVIEITPRGKAPKPTITATGGNGTATIVVSLTSNGGNDITNYKYSLNGAPEYQFVYPESPTDTRGNTFTLNSLSPGNYTIRVIAVNSAGDSPSSDSVSFTAGSIPTPPTITATPGIGSVGVTVATTSTSPIIKYNYEYTTVSDFTSGITSASTANNQSPFTINNLTRGTTYYIRVAAVNSVGTSLFSAVSSFKIHDIPKTATIGQLSTGAGSIVVPFTHGENNGSPITGSIIQYSTSSTFSNVNTITINDTSTPYTITGLLNDTTYYIRVASVNDVGKGPDSSPSNAKTPTVPGAPTISSIQGGNQKAIITFTAPTLDGRSPITRYEYSTNGGTNYIAFSPAVTSSSSSPVTITTTSTTSSNTSLQNGTQYSVILRAVNACGAGSPSNSINVTPSIALIQIGSSLTGIDWFGEARSFNRYVTNNGTIYLAIGSPSEGTSPKGAVYIYKWNTTTSSWEQNTKLTQTSTLAFGEAVDMVTGNSGSTHGITEYIAVGATETTSLNSLILAGSVSVYRRSGSSSWVQLGQTLYGSGLGAARLGNSVSLSSDARTFVCGGYIYDAPATSQNYQIGLVQVYTISGSGSSWSWSQKGSNIIGSRGDFFGSSVGISADGNTIVVGAPQPSYWTIAGIPGSNKGYVNVYTWNVTTSKWVQKGKTITGEVGNRLGTCVSISSDGNTIAACSQSKANGSGHVVYYWDSNTSEWVKKGNINYSIGSSNAVGNRNTNISLSSDGSIFVCNPAILKWNNTNSSWDVLQTYTNNSVNLLTINSDATLFAIPFNASTSSSSLGTVTTYKLDY